MDIRAALSAVVVGVVVKLIAGELEHGADPIAHRIIRAAARRLPAHVRERYAAEWRALIADIAGPVSKIVHALSLWIGAGNIAQACPPEKPRNLIFLCTKHHAELQSKPVNTLVTVEHQFEMQKDPQVREYASAWAHIQAINEAWTRQHNDVFSRISSDFHAQFEALAELPNRYNAWLRLPEFRLPEFKFPELKVPEFRLPDLKIPELKVPELSDTWLKLAKFDDALPGLPKVDELKDH